MAWPPDARRVLLDRYDPAAFELPRSRRVLALLRDDDRLAVEVTGWGAEVVPAGRRPDATLAAPGPTWSRLAADVRGGLGAFRGGRLRIRGDLNAAIGFLAATSAAGDDDTRLRVRAVRTAAGELSTLEAGAGEPLLLLHGLGATKASFLPTIEALAARHRVVAYDLPGFGDSAKPVGAAYDADFFARSAVALADALGFDRVHVLGHSLGGRAALQMGVTYPGRVASLSLLMPSMPWLRSRRWAPLLRLVRPELGLLQPTPAPVVDEVVRRLVPGSRQGWTATGVDEFLRAYRTARGRAAFYAAARGIYLEEGSVPGGLWERLRGVEAPCLFIWGRRDSLVPSAFARHVDRALPAARHVFLDCGHVPQFECPTQLHAAVAGFLADHPIGAGRILSLRGRRASRRPVA